MLFEGVVRLSTLLLVDFDSHCVHNCLLEHVKHDADWLG